MKEIKVGMIGFGTVGKGLAEVLYSQRERLVKRTGMSIRLAGIADHGTTTLDRGAPPAPSDDDTTAPVTFELDYDTAAAIARGELAAQVAFMQGRLKLVGNVDVLIRDGAVLDGVADALGDLRADTEF